MKRIEQLDGLRAVAFLLVYLNHSIYLPMAWVGVDLFFVLSGFLITGILLDTKDRGFRAYISRFYSRRARRILPPYFLVLAAVVVLLPPPDWGHIWWQFFTFLQNFGVAFGWRAGVLDPYWSLAVEEQFYLLWPLVVFAVPRRMLARVAIALVVLAPVLRATFTPVAPSYLTIFTLLPFRMDLLAAGAVLTFVWRDHSELLRARERWLWVAFVASSAIFVGGAAFIPTWRAKSNGLPFNTIGYSASVVAFTCLLALALVSRSPLLQRPLRNIWLRRLGVVSYTCYLVHMPILSYTMPLGRILGSVLGLAATLAVAALSWRLIERPLLGSPESVATPVPSR
ncbi:MAG: acyltransferase [Gemmatimonadaceae bacterium]|nr:acyltransferase [Gemmatimonadaceae bacterium]